MITASEARARSDNGSYEKIMELFTIGIERACSTGGRSCSISYKWEYGKACDPDTMDRAVAELRRNGYTVSFRTSEFIPGYDGTIVEVKW